MLYLHTCNFACLSYNKEKQSQWETAVAVGRVYFLYELFVLLIG